MVNEFFINEISDYELKKGGDGNWYLHVFYDEDAYIPLIPQVLKKEKPRNGLDPVRVFVGNTVLDFPQERCDLRDRLYEEIRERMMGDLK